MINGIINVYKEKGFTSHDVVAKLRGILKQKKIGHTGTLDPDATGVLPVCIGNATKLCDLLTDKDKTYETVLLLGKVTDTQDITGEVIEESPVTVSEAEIENVIRRFIGPIEQVPPMYSALKVNGRKLYELAREGKVVERKARPVIIHDITIHSIVINGETNEVRMSVSCSKGTYIRTLCHDIGEALGCGGCMKSLVRTKVSRFLLEDALTLTKIEELQAEGNLSDKIILVDEMFADYPSVCVNEEGNRYLVNGNPLTYNHLRNSEIWETLILKTDPQVKVYNLDGQFTGIYQMKVNKQGSEYSNDKDNYYLKTVKMFL
ncbi:MAG TPA: tRNA pseudouridine(55) synthase TruB [Lachnospiraceae bacterium]|nr:tRNA pseudouridine(55) synthase TruB [Lachnospiraceae bacterium]